jgi:hypothetical protein
VTAREMLVDLMGMGKRPDEITPDSAMFRTISSQYEQSLAATADVLGLRFDEIRREVRTATLPHDVEVSCGMLPAGSVVGQILSWTACRSGCGRCWRPRSTGRPPTTSPVGCGHGRRVPCPNPRRRGPPLRVELTIGNDPIDLPGVAGRSARGRDDGGARHPLCAGRAARRRHTSGVRRISVGRRYVVTTVAAAVPGRPVELREADPRLTATCGRLHRRAIALPARGSGADPTLRSARRWRSGRRRC